MGGGGGGGGWPGGPKPMESYEVSLVIINRQRYPSSRLRNITGFAAKVTIVTGTDRNGRA